LDYLASIDLVLKGDEEEAIPTFVRNLTWKLKKTARIIWKGIRKLILTWNLRNTIS